MENLKFDPNVTYRFLIAFFGENDEEEGYVEVRHFTVDLDEKSFERLSWLDEYEDCAWTEKWRNMAHTYGQLGNCTDPESGEFGFDSNEYWEKDNRTKVMQEWHNFLTSHGFVCGQIESCEYEIEDYLARTEAEGMLPKM